MDKRCPCALRALRAHRASSRDVLRAATQAQCCALLFLTTLVAALSLTWAYITFTHMANLPSWLRQLSF